MTTKKATVINPSGLHARPAHEFVECADSFKSDITIRRLHGDGTAVNAKSMVLILTLGIGQGVEVELAANGPDEAEAAEKLAALIQSGFGE